MSEHTRLTVSTDHAVKGIDATVVENRHLRVVLLQGKGGDILEFRDKRTDIDVLWSIPHNWQPPSNALSTSTPTRPGTRTIRAGGSRISPSRAAPGVK